MRGNNKKKGIDASIYLSSIKHCVKCSNFIYSDWRNFNNFSNLKQQRQHCQKYKKKNIGSFPNTGEARER